jgi:RNA polymerase sigma-54 factor
MNPPTPSNHKSDDEIRGWVCEAGDPRVKPRPEHLEQLRGFLLDRLGPLLHKATIWGRPKKKVEILQLSILDLQERIEEELGENPVLEDARKTSIPEIDGDETPPVSADPKPDADSHNVMSDLFFERNEQGVYDVRLSDENSPHLAISRDYQRLLRNKLTDQPTRDYIRKKIRSAQCLIDSIEQRRNTLLKVARAIIEHQKDFLDKGPEFIESLKLQQIADRVGVHVTAVRQAVDDKWVQTPRGIFALERFFGGETTAADGDEIASDSIEQKLPEVLAKEGSSGK